MYWPHSNFDNAPNWDFLLEIYGDWLNTMYRFWVDAHFICPIALLTSFKRVLVCMRREIRCISALLNGYFKLLLLHFWVHMDVFTTFKCHFNTPKRFSNHWTVMEESMSKSELNLLRPDPKWGRSCLCHARVGRVRVCYGYSYPTIGLTPSRQLIPASLAYTLR